MKSKEDLPTFGISSCYETIIIVYHVIEVLDIVLKPCNCATALLEYVPNVLHTVITLDFSNIDKKFIASHVGIPVYLVVEGVLEPKVSDQPQANSADSHP